MEEKIIKIFNKIFLCLKDSNLKSLNDISNSRILYLIGTELDKKIFSSLDTAITGKDDIKIRISELNEISEAFLTLLKSSGFIPTEKFKQEIESIDIIGLANKENKILFNFSLIILITIFYSSKKELLDQDELGVIKNLINPYITLSKNEQSDKEMKKIGLGMDQEKIKLIEEQYNNLKKKITNVENKNTNLMKELIEAKNKIKSLEKIIEEKNNKMGILQSKLDEKIKLIKERDIQLNKEIESNMELKFKLDELDPQSNKIENLEEKNNNKFKEIMQLNEDLKTENSQLNEIIKVMETKMEEKTLDEKEKEEIKNRYEKEFELMSSAIYNLGFQFWSLKLEDSEKLKQNENWLIRERIKQYNGDY